MANTEICRNAVPSSHPELILVSPAEYKAMVALGGPSMDNYLRIHGIDPLAAAPSSQEPK